MLTANAALTALCFSRAMQRAMTVRVRFASDTDSYQVTKTAAFRPSTIRRTIFEVTNRIRF